MSSGQMVGALVGLVVSLLIAFIAGLLIGRYETTEDLYAMQQQARQTNRTTVPLGTVPSRPSPENTGSATVAKKATQPIHKSTLPAPTAKTTSTKRPVTASKPAKKPATKPSTSIATKKPVAATVKKPVPPVKKPAAAKAAVTPATPKKPKPKPVNKYGVQVAGLSSKKTADATAAKLVKQNYDAWVRPPSGGGHLYGVMIGHFPTRTDAIVEMRKLRQKKAFADAWVP